MNKQEIFDKVAIHLLTQNKRSRNNLSLACRYRGPNGLKCAIGVLILDDIYHPEVEGGNVLSASTIDYLRRSGISIPLDEDARSEVLCFLLKLQRIHDLAKVELWEEKLRLLAKEYNLETAKIDHFRKGKQIMIVNIETPDGSKEIEIDSSSFGSLISKEDIEESFFDHIVSGYPDIFFEHYIGYWAYGLKFFKEDSSWLCIEEPFERSKAFLETVSKVAVEQYKSFRKDNWKDCPKKSWKVKILFEREKHEYNLFIMDPQFACTAVAAAFKQYGQESIDNWDAHTLNFGVNAAYYGKEE